MDCTPLPTASQARLPHDAPDSFVVDLPARTRQRFGDTTIAIADKRFTNFLDGLLQLLIALLMRRRATVLVVPLPIDSQQPTQATYGSLWHLLSQSLYERVSLLDGSRCHAFFNAPTSDRSRSSSSACCPHSRSR